MARITSYRGGVSACSVGMVLAFTVVSLLVCLVLAFTPELTAQQARLFEVCAATDRAVNATPSPSSPKRTIRRGCTRNISGAKLGGQRRRCACSAVAQSQLG